MARYEIEGKVVLITGAARGIGLDAAERLAQRGAKLALIDRDAEMVEGAATAIGGETEPFVADVADRDSIAAAIKAARDRFGGIDVAVAGAGISGTPTPATEIGDEEFERVIAVNLLGVWRTLSGVLPDVIERRGYLLPIASLASALPTPLITPYGASKAGVHSIARSLRFELAHTGAKVGCGYFSVIDTRLARDAMAEPVVQRSLNSIPGRLQKALPVGAAGAAIVRGIERRSKRVCAPGWVTWVVSLHGLGGPLEAIVARDPRFVRNLRRAQKEASDAEFASQPVPEISEPEVEAPAKETR